jgi:coproporphyrinogen III oxidase-like Fe-S oxidoreductase
MMGLRLAEGVDLGRLAKVGALPDPATVAHLIELDLVEMPNQDRLRATRRGRFVLNEVVRKLSMTLVASA